jgi:vitamin B12 transporter
LFSPAFQGLVYSPDLDTLVSIFSFEGNSDLKPEESINYEVGIKTQFKEYHNLSFNVFYYKIDNLIDFQGATFRPVNVNESTIKGIEGDYTFQYNDLKLNLNATHQDANNDQNNTPLLRRPNNKINVSIDKFFNKFSIGSSMRYNSKNPDFGIELKGYTIIDLRAAFSFNQHWKMGLKIENVTDKDYQIINGFNTAKNSAYLTVEWQQ